MTQYMLDTNSVSHLIKKNPAVIRRIIDTPMASLAISAVTKGELIFGLSKRPKAKQLHAAVRELLKRVNVMPWDDSVAELYGKVRAQMESKGKVLAPLDLMIATHALDIGAVLVTNDQAFQQVLDLKLEDWSNP